MMRDIPVKLLQQIQLFSSLTEEELRNIAGNISIKRYRKQETILIEQDTNHFMYVVLSGKVKAVRATDDGKEMILAIHQAGESFGEISLIDGRTSPARVVALDATIAAIISKKEFFSILKSQPKVLDLFLQMLCARLRESWEQVQMLNMKHASARVRLLLHRLSSQSGVKTPKGTTITIKLTHQDIADMTGLTRETVTRVLDKLQKDSEILVLSNKHIHLNLLFLERDFTNLQS